MNLTLRQRKILQILIDEQHEVTLAYIANVIQVSIRTVHRELVPLSRNLARDYGLRIQARPGLGLRLLGDDEALKRCRTDLQDSIPSDTSPEERQRMLCFLLLETNEAVKLSALAEDLYTSVLVVRHDLDALQSWFALQGLQLTLRKGMGLRLEGSERQKRESLVMLLWEQFGEVGMLSLLRSDGNSTNYCMEESDLLALRIIPLQYIRYAEHVLAGLSRELLPDMAPQDYLQLVLVLAVASVRRKSGYILEPEDQNKQLISNGDLKRIAKAAITGVFSHFSISVDDAEEQTIERFLRGAHHERLGTELLADNLQVLPEIALLIQKCGEALGQDLSGDKILRDGLLAHWVPALYRLQHKLPIKNPLLHRIKDEYGTLYATLTSIVNDLFPTLSIPDDEIAYLVLHFGSALSRISRERKRYRALVVCSAGIGTANMLASRLRERFPEIELIANVSWFDIQTMTLEGWDILISTIPLPLPQDTYVLVDPLLSEEGVQRIRTHLNAKDIVPRRDLRSDPASFFLASARVSPSHSAEVLIKNIIDHIFVFSSCNYGKEWYLFLKGLIQACADLGYITDVDTALTSLAQRSSDHGILLTDSHCLFLHARSTALLAPLFTIHRLEEPLSLEAGFWPSMPQTILLMLAPQKMDDQELSLLNEISVSLLDSDVLMHLEKDSEQNIRNFYKQLLDTDQGGIGYVRNNAY